MDVRRMLMLGLLLSSAPAWAKPPAKIALTGARIIPVVGEDIASGTVLVENGEISAVGEKVEIPYDAMEVDLSGKVLMPGMVDAHSWSGLDVPNENLPVSPFVDVYDAIDPSRLYFEDALRDGVTSIHVIVANNCVIGGLSRVVHPIGLTPDEMTLRGEVALKMSVAPKRGSDRMAQMATLRETFLELADYLENLAEEKYEKSLEEKDKKIDVGPDEARKRGKPLITPEDYDDAHANLVRLTEGRLDVFMYCEVAGDVGRALTLAEDNGFIDRTVLVLGTHAHKAVKEIKRSGRPVVLDPELVYRERDPVTGKISETFVPKVYADAGVAFSLLPSPDNSLAERYLTYQAARCIRHGIPRETALKAITLNPATASGVGDQVGSIEKGKVANLVVLSGDPLDFNTWVDAVYINGIHAYDRATDVRLKQLLGEEKKEVADETPKGDEPKNAADKPADSTSDEAATGDKKKDADEQPETGGGRDTP